MTELVEQVKIEASPTQTIEYLVYYVFGALEVLLGFRLILKMTGASVYSGFVQLIYGLTNIFISPFEGIFRRGIAQGGQTTSVFEPSVFVAILVYAVVAYGIVRLVRISSGEKQSE
jgi:hypothetical protein